MSAMTTVLNKQLANWIVTEMKLRNYHWHVRGPQFFTLHSKFEELYGEAAGHIDELAERVRSLGDDAVPTLAEALKQASVREDATSLAAERMVSSVVSDFRLMIEELQLGISYAESVGDEATGDLLLDILAGLQKHVWMLSAFLGD